MTKNEKELINVLLIVDLQYSFLPGGALAVPKSNEITSVIMDLVTSGDYQYIITSQAIDVVGNIEVEHGITVILIPEPSEPGIPGYHLYIMICIISIVSAIIIKRRYKNKS